MKIEINGKSFFSFKENNNPSKRNVFYSSNGMKQIQFSIGKCHEIKIKQKGGD